MDEDLLRMVTDRSPFQSRYRAEPSAPKLPKTSGASPYRRGRDFERAIRGQLERRDYFVMRAHGSKGKVDLLAVGHATVLAGISGLFIQAKRTGDIGSAEWNEVCDIAWAADGWPVVCFRPSKMKTAYMRLDGKREKGRPGRPWSVIDPTDCSLLPVQPVLTAAR